jgi:hypothetical protein
LFSVAGDGGRRLRHRRLRRLQPKNQPFSHLTLLFKLLNTFLKPKSSKASPNAWIGGEKIGNKLSFFRLHFCFYFISFLSFGFVVVSVCWFMCGLRFWIDGFLEWFVSDDLVAVMLLVMVDEIVYGVG